MAADLDGTDGVWVVAHEALAADMAEAAFGPGGGDEERAARVAGRRLGAGWLVTGGYQRLRVVAAKVRLAPAHHRLMLLEPPAGRGIVVNQAKPSARRGCPPG